MSKNEAIDALVDSKLKAEAERVLEKLGLTAAEAIRLFYRQVALHRGLPFDVRLPNATTRRAMRDIQLGRDLTSYQNTNELFEKLGR